ncbi:hypothetical protein C8R45DRAFT_1100812 [Mycena sanguinolenta]|nr:hypothetical protein C8R45DRAFT_1100812 [Mycena sanguinolenta]
MRRREMNLNFDTPDVNTDIQNYDIPTPLDIAHPSRSTNGLVSKFPNHSCYYAFDAKGDLTALSLADTAETTAALTVFSTFQAATQPAARFYDHFTLLPVIFTISSGTSDPQIQVSSDASSPSFRNPDYWIAPSTVGTLRRDHSCEFDPVHYAALLDPPSTPRWRLARWIRRSFRLAESWLYVQCSSLRRSQTKHFVPGSFSAPKSNSMTGSV